MKRNYKRVESDYSLLIGKNDRDCNNVLQNTRGERMKQFFSCVVLCLLVIMLLLGIEVITRCRDNEIKLQIVEYEKEQEIEELRKEIRLLKTDISIMQIGFENE